ncbi:hypothetical protein [Rhodoferax sp.]|uniref:hypothetical protein n=1 Tax=Rhodoferax sp. TaxID=50421 RepID=UPI00272666E7|nr:hypothetical protein [Rhodoferax sp.]MDO8320951.1 hypothetical protein [Rhodoferax sp.]
MERSESRIVEDVGVADRTPTTAQDRPHQGTVPLARIPELFRLECVVPGTVALCLPDPDMLSRIIWGHGLENLTRRLSPLLHQTLRQAADILEGKRTPRNKTVREIATAFAPFLEPETTSQLLRGELNATTLPSALPWHLYQRSMGPLPDTGADPSYAEVVAYLVEREAFYARVGEHERASRASPEKASFQSRVQAGQDAWRRVNPELTLPAFLLIEEFLHGMAHFETLWGSVGDPDAQVWTVLNLLAPGRRPLGHWLGEVVQASGAQSLAKLAERLFALDVRYKGENKKDPFIKVDTLKKWSASRQILMPLDALAPVLTGVPRAMKRTLEGGYCVARMLTFLVDLLRAGTRGDPPMWDAAQAQIKSRYTEVYRQALASR